MTAEVLICDVGTCTAAAQPEHTPCCSSTFHGKSFCCEHYCRTHFVEANQCSPASHTPGPLCPECAQGKPLNCAGQALDANDDLVPCGGGSDA